MARPEGRAPQFTLHQTGKGLQCRQRVAAGRFDID